MLSERTGLPALARKGPPASQRMGPFSVIRQTKYRFVASERRQQVVPTVVSLSQQIVSIRVATLIAVMMQAGERRTRDRARTRQRAD